MRDTAAPSGPPQPPLPSRFPPCPPIPPSACFLGGLPSDSCSGLLGLLPPFPLPSPPSPLHPSPLSTVGMLPHSLLPSSLNLSSSLPLSRSLPILQMSKLRLREKEFAQEHLAHPPGWSVRYGCWSGHLGLDDCPSSWVVCVVLSTREATGLARPDPCSVGEQPRCQLGAGKRCRASAPLQTF